MHLVDVHAHLDAPEFANDLDDVLRRAKARGVVTVIAQGINYESNQRVLAMKNDIVQAALGIYPTEAHNVELGDYERETAFTFENTLAFIEEHREECIAIGEVGIDFKESADRETQIENFRKVVKLAKNIQKPLIIHSRKAEKEVMDVLEEEKYFRAILHCFMGSKKLVKRGVELGLSFSIPTAVVRVEQFQQNVEMIPLKQLFVETDAPFMGPMKDMRNEPSTVREGLL